MYGWIGKNFYNHRVILTSTIEYDNFQRLRKFRLSEFFFYVILKLSIVRSEKRMNKSKNLKIETIDMTGEIAEEEGMVCGGKMTVLIEAI